MESKSIDNFLKGLISRVSDDKIADNSFSDCMNIDLSENYLPKSVKGKIKVNSVALDNKQCQGMTIYNNKELGSLMIVACGGYIYYSPLNTDNFQKYKIDNAGTLEDVVIDENVRVRFVQYNDRIFVFTGKYPVIENEDFTNACILVLYKTTATFINRDSFYAWTKNGSVFYTLSATPTNGDIIFSDLYRTKLSVTVVSYDSGNDKFTDSNGQEYTRTANSDKIDNNIPQGLKIGFIHQERLFGLGSIEDENGVYWSQPYDPTRWTPVYGLNYDTVGKDDGEIITGGASFGGTYIYIFKQHNVYRYLTNGDIDQWSSNKVDTTYGCVAHETIRLFNGLLTYLSPEGVAQLNGNSAVLIDEQINDKTTNVSVSSDVQIERSYTKNSNWNEYGATGETIVIDDGISKVKDITFGNDYINNINGKGWSNCNDRTLFCFTYGANSTVLQPSPFDIADTPPVTRMLTPTDGELYLFGYRDTGITFRRSTLFFLLGNRSGIIKNIKVFISTITSHYISANVSIKLYTYNAVSGLNCIATSNTINSSNISAQTWQTFVFNNDVVINSSDTIYFGLSATGTCNDNGGSTFRIALGGYGQRERHLSFVEYLDSQTESLQADIEEFTVRFVINDGITQYWLSQEIDTNTQYNWNLKELIVGKYNNSFYRTDVFSYKIEIGHYDVSGTQWSNISDIITVNIDNTSFNNTYLQYLINNSQMKRYIQIKITSVSGGWAISFLTLLTDNGCYLSKNIQITGSVSSIKGWGIAQIVRTGSDDVSNKAIVYMRSGNTVTELENATYYEINNNEQIPASIGLKCLVQFKVEFPIGSDNKISSIKIFYYTVISVTKVCAFVWKGKYRLNMAENNENDDNAVEYIYDKDGYWTIKDNENNFDYCASINDLFACSGTDGTIYKKETGYKNNGVSYNSYFITKRFVLSDFENLYRKFKVRFVSASIEITIGVSVDDRDFVNYIIPKNSNLIEIIKTLTGIVKGQSIKFKFSWQANDSTQIHNLMWYWQVLRELNRG